MKKVSLNWKEIAEAIGIIAIVMSLYFVGLQVKQSTIIAESETGMQQLENTLEAHSQINEHAELWIRGLAGDELTAVEAVIFENLLINLNDITFHVVSNYMELGERLGAEIVLSDFAGFLHRNPGARQLWERRENLLNQNRENLGFNTDGFSVDAAFDYSNQLFNALVALDARSE